jgi:hypothetical protein
VTGLDYLVVGLRHSAGPPAKSKQAARPATIP